MRDVPYERHFTYSCLTMDRTAARRSWNSPDICCTTSGKFRLGASASEVPVVVLLAVPPLPRATCIRWCSLRSSTLQHGIQVVP